MSSSPSRPRKGFPIERAVFSCGVFCFCLLNLHINHVLYSSSEESTEEVTKFPPVASLKLPTPVFVVGLPKVGTSSIHRMFSCSGIKASHYCCKGSQRTHTHCNDGGQTCLKCMQRNKKTGRPILENCGNYTVYAQLDAEWKGGIYLPQQFDLQLIHEYAPTSTFLLNLRPPKAWVHSVSNWYGLGGRFLRQFHVDFNQIPRMEALEEIFTNQTQIIRNFVRDHPSHALVEVDITDPLAGQALANAFGIYEHCWDKNGYHTSGMWGRVRSNLGANPLTESFQNTVPPQARKGAPSQSPNFSKHWYLKTTNHTIGPCAV